MRDSPSRPFHPTGMLDVGSEDRAPALIAKGDHDGTKHGDDHKPAQEDGGAGGGDGGDDLIGATEESSANPGKDTVKAGKGNDQIYADDGSKDVIDYGSGTDTVRFDKGLDQVAANCEKRAAV
jgi:hypothetical protein